MITEDTTKFQLSILYIYHRIRWLLKRLLDCINFIIICLSFLRTREILEKTQVKKILIVNLQGIGDMISMTPLLEALKKDFSCQIDILCEGYNGQIFKNDPRINIINYEGIFASLRNIRRSRYGLTICPYRAEHSGFITAFSGARYKIGYIYSLGLASNNMALDKRNIIKTRDPKIKADNIRKSLGLTKARNYDEPIIMSNINESRKIGNFLGKFRRKKIIIFNCQNKWISRTWPADRWIGLGEILAKDQNNIILLIGSKNDYQKNESIREKIFERLRASREESKNFKDKGHVNKTFKKIIKTSNNVINISSKFGLTETVELLKRAQIFITTDSGPMHMAFAAKTKIIIGLFGSTSPKIFMPQKYSKYAIWKNSKGDKCPLYNHNNEPLTNNPLCMTEITVEDVMKLIKK